jgi:cytochrome c oxidase accessory protein FixG
MRVDIPARRIYFWGLTLFATDGWYLLLLLGTLGFGIFLITALFGRAWCGWACPQTVFLESVIRPIERLIDGPPSKQRKLDKAPWTRAKITRRLLKWGAFAVVAGAVGTTFVAYFLGREGVWEAQSDPMAHPAGTAIFLGISAVMLFDYVWFREQTCIVACPYGRFQSVMMDPDSLTVGYDEKRGEPRGRLNVLNSGDCIDCKACVQVCPTGIDIRRGGQMECVQCMSCIDACDAMMSKVGRDPGLIRLSSLNALEGKAARFLRPRVVVYAVGLAAVFTLLVTSLANHQNVSFNLGRQPQAPFIALPNGGVQNSLRLRISNRASSPLEVDIALLSPADGELVTPSTHVVVPAEDVQHVPVFLLAAPGVDTSAPWTIRVTGPDGLQEDLSIEFMSTSRSAGESEEASNT